MKSITKLLITFVLLLLINTVNIYAAFLKNVPQTITQPNGITLSLFASGDEFYNWLHDENGYTVIQNNETGFYVFADKINGELVPTNLIFGINNPQELGLQKGLITPDNPISNEMRNNFNEQLKILNYENANHRKNSKQSDQFQSQRTINNIVIFVEFADASFENIDSIKTSKQLEYNTASLSMHAYFNEVSYGQLAINTHFFSQNNAVKSQRNRGYLLPQSPTNPQGYTNFGDRIAREFEILTEAISAIQSEIPATLDVDSDNDDWVDALTIIFQGNATPSSALWPHAFRPAVSALTTETINGKRIRNFNVLLETFSDVGVAIHEMGHILGAPDFYTYDAVQPVEYWDVMSHGNYVLPHIPHFTMHLKQKYFGWIENIPEITESGVYTLNPVSSATNNVFRVNSPYSYNEYFLLEYRRHIDNRFGGNSLQLAYPQNNGLMIYRVVPSVLGNLYSLMDDVPYEVYIYRPNGTTTVNGNISQALYSDEYQRTEINESTNPNGFLANGIDGALDIFEIQLINDGEQIQFGIVIPPMPPRYYDLTVGIIGSGTVETNPTTTTNLLEGTEIILTANATVDYEFLHWRENDTVLSTENPLTITLDRNRTIRAVFVMSGPTIVLNENNDGWGSLRQVVRDAPENSIITFADTVNYITLTTGEIRITKNLTINGGSDTTRKITIDGNNNTRIFWIGFSTASSQYGTVNINNLNLTNSRSFGEGGAMYMFGCNFTATDCNFYKNTAERGGAMNVIYSNFTAINCNFYQNLALSTGGAIQTNGATFTVRNCNFNDNIADASGAAMHINNTDFTAINSKFYRNAAGYNGGAICLHKDGIFTVINCIFYNNSAGRRPYLRGRGGVFHTSENATLVAINSTFYNNSTTFNGGAIDFDGIATGYLFHCTFDKNKTSSEGLGGAVFNDTSGKLYIYNCIFTENTAANILNQITGEIIDDYNFTEGENGITRDLVFGTNQFNETVGYINPLPYAMQATRLTNASNFKVPDGITKNEILTALATDQAGKPRPFLSFSENEIVTYGAIEAPAIRSFTLTVSTTTGGTTNPSGTSERDTNEVVLIEAFPENCYKFSNWTNTDGTVISTENPLTVIMLSDTILTANFYRDTFNLILNVNPVIPELFANIASGVYKFICGLDSVAVIEAIPTDTCYEFVNWSVNDTFLSDENPLTVIVTSDSIITANFRYICHITQFKIWVEEHKNIDPTSRNYKVPVYISADENISNTVIEKLVLEVDRNLYFPRRVEPNTVNMNLNFIDSIIEMTFENITVPALSANEPKILLTIRGDIILGNKDSSEIRIDTVIFSQEHIEIETENGFISLAICEDGSDRFLTIFDYAPSITVKKNPVTEMLEVNCKTIERGDYSLEIVDLLGNATTVETWTVAGSTRIFDFKIDVSNFAIGSYFIVMNTPTNKYSARFVKQ